MKTIILTVLCLFSALQSYACCCCVDAEDLVKTEKPVYPKGISKEHFPIPDDIGVINEEHPIGPGYGSSVYGPYHGKLSKEGRFPVVSSALCSVKQALHWAAIVAQTDPTFPSYIKDKKVFEAIIGRIQMPSIIDALTKETAHNFASRLTIGVFALNPDKPFLLSSSATAVFHVLAEVLHLEKSKTRDSIFAARFIDRLLNNPGVLNSEEGTPHITTPELLALVPMEWRSHWQSKSKWEIIFFPRKSLAASREASGASTKTHESSYSGKGGLS